MARYGNDEAGFSVDFDSLSATLSVRGWGFWPADVGDAFGKAVIDACRSSPRGSALVLDFTELRPFRDEGQRSYTMLMSALSSLGLSKTIVMTTSQLTKLQLLRLTAQANTKSAVRFA